MTDRNSTDYNHMCSSYQHHQQQQPTPEDRAMDSSVQHQMLQTPEILLRSVVDRAIMDDDEARGNTTEQSDRHERRFYNEQPQQQRSSDGCSVKHFAAEHTPYERIINGNVIFSNFTSAAAAGDSASLATSNDVVDYALVAAMRNDCARVFTDDVINYAAASLTSSSSQFNNKYTNGSSSKGSIVLRLCNEHQFERDKPDSSSLFYQHRGGGGDEAPKSPPPSSTSTTPEPTMLMVKPPMSPASTPSTSSAPSSSLASLEVVRSSGTMVDLSSGSRQHQYSDENVMQPTDLTSEKSRVEKQNMLEQLGYKLRLPKLPPPTMYDPNYRQRIIEANRFWQTSLASYITISSCRNYLLHHYQQRLPLLTTTTPVSATTTAAATLQFLNGGAGDPAAMMMGGFSSSSSLPFVEQQYQQQKLAPNAPNVSANNKPTLTESLSCSSGINISEQDLMVVNRSGRLSDSGYFGRRVRARIHKLTSERRLALFNAVLRNNLSTPTLAATVEQALSQSPLPVGGVSSNSAPASSATDCMFEFEVHDLSEATLTLLSAIYERLQTHLTSIAQQATQKALQNSPKVVALSILKSVRQAIENVVEVFDNVEGQRAAQQNSSFTSSATTGDESTINNVKPVASNESAAPASQISASTTQMNRNLSLLFILYMPVMQPETLCLRCIIPLTAQQQQQHSGAAQPSAQQQQQHNKITPNNSSNHLPSLSHVPSWPKLGGNENTPPAPNNNSTESKFNGNNNNCDSNTATETAAANQQRPVGMRKQIGVVTRPLTLNSWGEIYFKDESDAREDNLRNTIMPFGFAQLSSAFKSKIIVPTSAEQSHVVINSGHVLEFKIATSGLYQPLATFSDFTPLGVLYTNLSLHDRFRGYVYSPYHEKMFSFHLCDVMYDMAPPRVGDAVEFTLRRMDDNNNNSNSAATLPAITYTACDLLTLPEGAFGRVKVEDEKHYNGVVVRAAADQEAGIVELRMSSSSSTIFGPPVSTLSSTSIVPLTCSNSSSSTLDIQNSASTLLSTSAVLDASAGARSSFTSNNNNKRFVFYEHSFEYDQSSIADVGYVVSFRLLHDPFSLRDLFGSGIAINLKIEAGLVRKRGHILALFDNYGFIELDSREDAWFHFSRLINCRADELFIGCPVEYSLLPKLPEKPTQQACYVRRLRKDGIVGYDRLLSQQTFRGEVLQAMRAVTPFQKQYNGKIAVYGPYNSALQQSPTDASCSLGSQPADDIVTRLTTPGADNAIIFTFSGLTDKRDHLRIGDIVSFKLATFRNNIVNNNVRIKSDNNNKPHLENESDNNNNTTALNVVEPRAVEIVRIMFRLRVRNIKRVDQFGFLDFYGSDLFFHLSHVSDGDSIKPGDIVDCVVRRDRTQRPCATSVVRRFWGKKALSMHESSFWLHTPQDLIVRDIINMRSGTTSAGVPPSSIIMPNNNGSGSELPTMGGTHRGGSFHHSSFNQQPPNFHQYRQYYPNQHQQINNNNNNNNFRQFLNNNTNNFKHNNAGIMQLARSLSSNSNSVLSSPSPYPQFFGNLPAYSNTMNTLHQQYCNAAAAVLQQQQQQQYAAQYSVPPSPLQTDQQQNFYQFPHHFAAAAAAAASGRIGAPTTLQPASPMLMPHNAAAVAAAAAAVAAGAAAFHQQQQQPATAAELMEIMPLLMPYAYYQQQQQQQQNNNSGESLAASQYNPSQLQQSTQRQHQQVGSTQVSSTGENQLQNTTAQMQYYTNPNTLSQQQPISANVDAVSSSAEQYRQQINNITTTSASTTAQQQLQLPLWRRRDDNVVATQAADFTTNSAETQRNIFNALRTSTDSTLSAVNNNNLLSAQTTPQQSYQRSTSETHPQQQGQTRQQQNFQHNLMQLSPLPSPTFNRHYQQQQQRARSPLQARASLSVMQTAPTSQHGVLGSGAAAVYASDSAVLGQHQAGSSRVSSLNSAYRFVGRNVGNNGGGGGGDTHDRAARTQSSRNGANNAGYAGLFANNADSSMVPSAALSNLFIGDYASTTNAAHGSTKTNHNFASKSIHNDNGSFKAPVL